jgi:hypothetical protein
MSLVRVGSASELTHTLTPPTPVPALNLDVLLEDVP